MSEAYVIDKNMGHKMSVPEGVLPTHNADGQAVVPLSDEQKYLFDARGWLLIPGVLSDGEVEEMRDFALRLHSDPESLPEHERTFVAGPLERLTDHPVVVGFLNEFLAFPHLSSPACYGFRMESSGLRAPSAEEGQQGVFSPHNGHGLFRFAVDSHHYQCVPGKAFSGLTRVVWELNPVQHHKGGTLLATGSHKSVYASPSSIQDPNSPVWDTYECPAGSVLFFTEALTHSTCPWTNTDNQRVGIFNLYNSVGSRWSPWNPPEKLIEQMPPMRQTLFRGTYIANNIPGYQYHGQNMDGRQLAG